MIVLTLEELAKEISFFIKEWLGEKMGFKCRTFYGSPFSMYLLAKYNILEADTKSKLIDIYNDSDKSDFEFHWEFNNYGLYSYFNLTQDDEVSRFLNLLRFKNTSCTNWTLLRSNVRLTAEKDIDLALSEAKGKIKHFQMKSGLILDDRNVKSFQYHCFSAAMIAEIYLKTQDKYFLNSFLKAVHFIRHFILRNGDTLYIGRGQEQSFGYSALIYILALAFKFTNDLTIKGDIDSILGFLRSFQRVDKSFPLVMNGVERGIPKTILIDDVNYPGWYPYNNYFDYLPFMGFFLSKAADVLRECDANEGIMSDQGEYRDKNFIKIVKKDYQAVLSAPGGYWTNDMPIPYIVFENKSIMPCYGGEQFQKSIYSQEGIPLPFCKNLNISMRKYSKSFFFQNTLFLMSIFGAMRRSFSFLDNEIAIRTSIYSLIKFRHYYLFKESVIQKDDFTLADNSFSVVSDKKLIFEGFQYSATGKLKLFTVDEKYSQIKIFLNYEN